MTRQNVPLGRILGIPIGLDYSWFLIFVLLTWMLGGGYYPAEFKNWLLSEAAANGMWRRVKAFCPSPLYIGCCVKGDA